MYFQGKQFLLIWIHRDGARGIINLINLPSPLNWKP